MPELVVDFDPTVCRVCHDEAVYVCPICEWAECEKLHAEMIRVGAKCNCGRALDGSDVEPWAKGGV